MPFEFKFPDVGEGITEGEVVKWLVEEGESVKEDQPIVQVETDKAVVDLPSPKKGSILKINYKAGERVSVGAVLVVIGEKGEKAAEKKDEEKKLKKEEKKEIVEKIVEKKEEPKRGQSVVGQLEEAESVEERPIVSVMKGESQSAKILAAPAVRKFAVEKGIDLMRVKGSGEEGRILMNDVQNHSGASERILEHKVEVRRSKEKYGDVEIIPLKGIRKSIAVNMMKSLNESAQVTVMEDMDVSRLWGIKEKEKKALDKKGISLTLLPFIVKAVVAALKEHPLLNASIEGEEIVLKKYYNIGIAIESEMGLVVPVVKEAEHKSIESLAKEINVLAQKARERKLSLEEMQGGTFTISNYGSIGGTYATPIINLGESAILGVGRAFDKVVSDRDAFKSIKTLPVSLTFDHRVIDGAQASRFLEKLKAFIEDPDHLLLEIE